MKYELIKARQIVQKYIGRPLYNSGNLPALHPDFRFEQDVFEIVHHINRNQSDNQPENLYVFRNMSGHSKYHREVKNWAYGLMGLSQKEKIEYLKTFPELKSNLDQLKEWNEKGLTLSFYWDD